MAGLSWPGWLGEIPRHYTREWSAVSVLTWLDIEQLCYVCALLLSLSQTDRDGNVRKKTSSIQSHYFDVKTIQFTVIYSVPLCFTQELWMMSF